MSEEVKTATTAEIDKEVVDIISAKEIEELLQEPIQMDRIMLNCYCETLSELQKLRSMVDDMSNLFVICSHDKITQFFGAVKDNYKDECNKETLKTKIARSYKKAKA